jgi:cytochrome c1
MAKGCLVCHQHAAVSESLSRGWAGVNLTNLKINPDYLRRWLKDPSAIRPATFMPTLGLSNTEIEALVAFLTANTEK